MRRKKTEKSYIKIPILLASCLLMLLAACGKAPEEPLETVWLPGSLFRINDEQYSTKEMQIYMMSARQEYETNYGSEIWNYVLSQDQMTLGAQVSNQILERVIYTKLICLKAKELGVVLTDEERKTAQESASSFMKQYVDTNLVMSGINEETLRTIYEDNLLSVKTYDTVTLAVDTEIPNAQVAQHTFYKIAIRKFKIDESGAKILYTEEECNALEQNVNALLETAKTRADVYTYMSFVTEDTANVKITVGESDLPDRYSEEVMSLRTGEFSRVISTDEYYYIFYCAEEFDEEATFAKKEELIAQRRKEAFQTLYESWRDSTEIEINYEEWMNLMGDNE